MGTGLTGSIPAWHNFLKERGWANYTETENDLLERYLVILK